VFTRFGTMVDERTRKVIEHGRRIRAVLGQPQFAPLPLGTQIALLYALNDRVLDEVPLDRMDRFRAGLQACLQENCPDILALDDKATSIPADAIAQMKASLATLARAVTAAEPGA